MKIRTYIVISLFILEFIRIPILAVLNLREFGGVLHIATLLSPVLLFEGFSWKFERSRYFLFWALWAFGVTLVLYNKGLSPGVYSSMLLSLFAPLGVPILIDALSNKRETWVRIVEGTLKIIFYVGTSYFIFEWILVSHLEIVSQCQLASFYSNERNSQFCDTSRRMAVGFFIYKDMSLAILMGAFFSFRDWPRQRINLLRLFLICFSIYAVDSITLMGIFFAILPIRFWNTFKEGLAVKVLCFAILLNIFVFSGTYTRIISYVINELDLNVFIPSISGCTREIFFISTDGIAQECQAREMHSLFYLFKFGVTATLSWYFTILYVGWKFLRYLLSGVKVPSLMFFPIIFLLNAVHYSGAESWGVNYLIYLVLFLCMSNEKDLRQRGESS